MSVGGLVIQVASVRTEEDSEETDVLLLGPRNRLREDLVLSVAI